MITKETRKSPTSVKIASVKLEPSSTPTTAIVYGLTGSKGAIGRRRIDARVQAVIDPSIHASGIDKKLKAYPPAQPMQSARTNPSSPA